MSRPRKFDWDEAARLRAEGWTLSALARRYGVTAQAVRRAVDPDFRARSDARATAWTANGRCPDCGAQTTRVRLGADHRCRVCAAKRLATSARDGELLCMTCRKWKPDNAFPRNRDEKFGRRGRHNICRPCQTEVKRDYRRRHPNYERDYSRARRSAA